MTQITVFEDGEYGTNDVAEAVSRGWDSIRTPSFDGPVKTVWEHRGVGVCVMSRERDMLVFIALLKNAPQRADYLFLALTRSAVTPLLARRVREEDVARTVDGHMQIAARLLELRDGGWMLRSVQEVRPGAKKDWEMWLDVVDPRDDRPHLRLPGTRLIQRRRLSMAGAEERAFENLGVLANLNALPDAPQGPPTGQAARMDRLSELRRSVSEVGRERTARIELIRLLRESDEPIEDLVTRSRELVGLEPHALAAAE